MCVLLELELPDCLKTTLTANEDILTMLLASCLILLHEEELVNYKNSPRKRIMSSQYFT